MVSAILKYGLQQSIFLMTVTADAASWHRIEFYRFSLFSWEFKSYQAPVLPRHFRRTLFQMGYWFLIGTFWVFVNLYVLPELIKVLMPKNIIFSESFGIKIVGVRFGVGGHFTGWIKGGILGNELETCSYKKLSSKLIFTNILMRSVIKKKHMYMF